MANNCFNIITIEGDKSEIKEFLNILQSNKNEEQGGCEIYLNLLEIFEKSGNNAKWFDMTYDLNSEEDLTIVGDSAWRPCLDLFTSISKKFTSFKIRYEYEEMGCDFSGYAEIENGICSDNCFTYWKGIFEMRGEEETKEDVIQNELSSYETEEDLQNADFFNLFSIENQQEILNAYKGIN